MNKIITISREFGSGGRELGKRLADELGFAYYDREIITEIAKYTGLSEEYINNISEKGVYSYPVQFAKSFAVYSSLQSNQTDILVAQQKVIREIAQRGNCIIVGRGADVILKEHNPMNIFVYADMESKVNRCMKKAREDEEQLTEKEIKDKIVKIDKDRKKYYSIISNQEWGNKENYHICINTSGREIKALISPLVSYIQNWFGGNK